MNYKLRWIKNQDAYNASVINLNGQPGVISDQKSVFMEKVVEAISSIDAQTGERTEKGE